MLLGDSITAQGGWFEPANSTAGYPLTLHSNAGLAGDTLANMTTRVASAVVEFTPKPSWCVVQGGGNDIRGGASAAAVEASLMSIYSTLLAAGIQPIATTVLPATVDQGFDAVYIAVNDWLRSYCAANSIDLCDWLPNVTTDPDGVLDAAMTVDQYHFNSTGKAALATAMTATLGAL